MARKLVGLSLVGNEQLPAGRGECLFWEHGQRLSASCGAYCSAVEREAWVRRVVGEWGECGRVAVDDGDALGFIKYAPPGYFPQARHMPSGPPVSDVVMIACMHVTAEARGRGIGGVLLRAALRDLAQRGERSVQVYADASGVRAAESPMVGVEFCLRHGFVVERPHPQVPLMRLDLKTLVSWTENLESVLESLRLPLRVPERAPATLVSPRGDS
jgi:GNAT superfamily N-acetyltransferase